MTRTWLDIHGVC